MNRERYINPSARTWVLEKKLLTRAQYDRLIEAENLQELFRLLNDTPYGEYLHKLEKPEDYELALLEAQNKAYEDLREMSPDGELIEFFLAKYDYHNYKVLFKELLSGEDHSDIYFSRDSLGLLAKRSFLLSEDEEVRERELPELYQEVKKAYARYEDPQVVDILVDRAYYERLHQLVTDLDSEFLSQYLADEIDFINIKMLLRMKKQMRNVTLIDGFLIPGGHIPVSFFSKEFFSPVSEILTKLSKKTLGSTMERALKAYEEEQKLSAMERVFEVHSLSLANEARKVTYGPEVLFNYVLQLETEIKNLRMIIVSKLNRVPADKVRGRLRRVDA